MKLNFEQPIQWKWLWILLASIILLLTVIIIADNLYDWRDFRYEKVQEQLAQAKAQTTQIENIADNLARVLQSINEGTQVQTAIQLNTILRSNGFPQYQRIIQDTSQSK